MKIIQVSPYYFPHLGGMETCVREISERLAKRGHRVDVYTSNIGNKEGDLSQSKNLAIRYLHAREIAHTPLIPSLFFKLLSVTRDTAIHVHISQPFVPEVVWLVSKIRKIPYIAHVHIDIEPTGKMGFLLPVYKKILLRVVLYSASKIVVPTKDYVALIGKKYSIPKCKIIIIPHGVDLTNFKNTSVKLHNPARLLFVGRLTSQKNVPLLIRAFKKTVDNNKNIELHIVGDGEDKSKIIHSIKALKLESKVVLHGYKRGKDLFKIYSNSDIFVLPSRYESFGIVAIEAMAARLPIVASDIPGVRNVIRDNETGLLVKHTPKDFSKAIEKLLINSKLREKLVENGFEEVKKYNWEKIVSKFEKTYRKVLNEAN